MLCRGASLLAQHSLASQGVSGQADVREPAAGQAGTLKARNREHALQVLDDCGGNVSAAARQLGISRTTLYSYLKQ